MITYGNYVIDLEKLEVVSDGGKNMHKKSIDDLPYREHSMIEALYTANYMLDAYAEEYGLTEDDCVEVAEQAREYMNDYNIAEDDAIYETLRDLGYSSNKDDNEEREE